jgi:formate dehydrogenase subunit gamma
MTTFELEYTLNFGGNMAGDHTEMAQAVCANYGNRPDALLEILHDIQEHEGFVPQGVLPVVAKALNVSRADVHGVMSFYHDFRKTRAGVVMVKICRAEACQSMGAMALIEQFLAKRKLALGDTSDDGQITIEAAYCLGNCAMAPAAMINGKLAGRLDHAKLEKLVVEAGQ